MSQGADHQGREQSRALYQRLYAAQHDLSQAAFFAEYILKKGWHFDPWERRWSTYMQQSAYTTAFVVSYSRPFTESRGWPKVPKKITPYNEEQRALHKRLLSLRTEVYAHTDVRARDIRPFKIGDLPSAVETLPRMKLMPSELNLTLEMISRTQGEIRRRLHGLIDLVADET